MYHVSSLFYENGFNFITKTMKSTNISACTVFIRYAFSCICFLYLQVFLKYIPTITLVIMPIIALSFY